MERTDLGKGRFLITHTPEEIQEIIRHTEISFHYGLIIASILSRRSVVDPKEVQELNNDIKRHYQIIDNLMPAPHETPNEPVSETERQIGEIVHAIINEDLPIEEAVEKYQQVCDLLSPFVKLDLRRLTRDIKD